MADREARKAARRVETIADREARRAARRDERRAARHSAGQQRQKYEPSRLDGKADPSGAVLPDLKAWLQQWQAPRSFRFRGKSYRYFRHEYNSTWLHERAVEVPIVYGLVRKHRAGRVLEIGNVLPHYFPVDHDVVDKYEPGERVINQDILDFAPEAGYDLIVCPAHAGPALPCGAAPEHDPEFSYTMTFNLTGWPAAVVRAGTSPEGLPIGVQLVARPWREDVALAAASRSEADLGGWQPPPL
jgi:Asp-tRNA(Asn)/Glu-tRNA(Gln) amidotransferase A subunit family amidase